MILVLCWAASTGAIRASNQNMASRLNDAKRADGASVLLCSKCMLEKRKRKTARRQQQIHEDHDSRKVDAGA